jgi:hypothetical protein
MLKKLGIGAYLALGTFVLTIVSWIIYGVSVTAPGYFHSVSVSYVVLFSIFALLCYAASIALSFVKVEGTLAKVLPIIQSILLVGACVFLISNAINIIGARAEGWGYIYFSDSNVLSEVQTADNMSSAALSITSFIFYLVTWAFSLATLFFNLTKKNITAETDDEVVVE